MPRGYKQIAAVILLAIPVVLLARGNAGQPASGSDAAKVRSTPAPYTSPSSGKGMFVAYCASCHGAQAKGDGPAAASMKIHPADLTQLAARNGGKFPANYVAHIIQGDSVTYSHGSREMPVWGPIFRSMETKSDGVAQLRVRNLTKYLATLQQK